MKKLHPGKKQDCPKCKQPELGLDECYRLIQPRKGK